MGRAASILRSRRGAVAIALGCYGAATVFLTWPLAPNAATHLPETAFGCGFDNLYSGWTLAHQSAALISDPAHIADTNVFHPATRTLFYGPTATGALAYFAPVFWISGNPTLALNVTLYLSIVLTALSLHLVVRRWTDSDAAGAVSGAAYLLTGWILWEWLPTTPHWAVLQYMPVIILLSATPATGLARNAALFGLIVLQCLTDLVYVAPAVLAPLGVLALARVTRRPTRSAGLALLAVLVLATLVLLVPVYPHLALRADNPDLARQSFWPTDPDWFRRVGTPLPWGLFFRNAPTALPPAAFWLIGAGAVSFLLHRRKHAAAWGTAALWAVVSVAMSLTPTVRIGEQPIDLPHAWVARWIPIYDYIRVPSRLGVSALIALALLAGLAFAECAERIAGARRRNVARLVRAGFAAVVILGMHAQYRARFPDPKRAVAGSGYAIAPAIGPDGPITTLLRQPGGPLIELPSHLSTDPRQRALAPVWHARAMYRSIFHGRKILNGYASYWPAGFPERMHVARRIFDPPALAELRRTTGLELFLVHSGAYSAQARATWTALAESSERSDLHLLARDGDELLFGVR